MIRRTGTKVNLKRASLLEHVNAVADAAGLQLRFVDEQLPDCSIFKLDDHKRPIAFISRVAPEANDFPHMLGRRAACPISYDEPVPQDCGTPQDQERDAHP